MSLFRVIQIRPLGKTQAFLPKQPLTRGSLVERPLAITSITHVPDVQYLQHHRLQDGILGVRPARQSITGTLTVHMTPFKLAKPSKQVFFQRKHQRDWFSTLIIRFLLALIRFFNLSTKPLIIEEHLSTLSMTTFLMPDFAQLSFLSAERPDNLVEFPSRESRHYDFLLVPEEVFETDGLKKSWLAYLNEARILFRVTPMDVLEDPDIQTTIQECKERLKTIELINRRLSTLSYYELKIALQTLKELIIRYRTVFGEARG